MKFDSFVSPSVCLFFDDCICFRCLHDLHCFRYITSFFLEKNNEHVYGKLIMLYFSLKMVQVFENLKRQK